MKELLKKVMERLTILIPKDNKLDAELMEIRELTSLLHELEEINFLEYDGE